MVLIFIVHLSQEQSPLIFNIKHAFQIRNVPRTDLRQMLGFQP